MTVDLNQLRQVLQSLSTDDQTRQQAEVKFNEWKRTNPNGLVRSLLSILNTEHDFIIRTQAVDFIRIVLCNFILHRNQATAHEVVQALVDIAGADTEADNRLKKYIHEAFCQMVLTLKREFVPYLPHLIPNVLKGLNIELEPVIDKEDYVEVCTADGKETWLGLKRSVFDEVFQTVNLLSALIQVLGPQFGEYLVPAAESLLSLLSAFSSLNDSIPEIFTAIAELFTVARELSANDPAARQMLSLWAGQLIEESFKGLTLGGSSRFETEGLLETSKCLHKAGPDVLNAQQVGAICERAFALMGESCQRRLGLATRKKNEEDQDVYGGIGADEEIEQELLSALREIIAAIMSFHADLYLQTSARLCSKFIETHLDSNCTPDDRALALRVCGDILEHLKDKGAPLWPTFASHLVESIGDSDPGVRQAAMLGVIQAAKCLQFPAELIQKATAKLDALLSAKQSQEKALLSATDNMIAALNTIVPHRSSCLQPSPEQFLHLWISNLPLEVDDEEGRKDLGNFVDLIVQRSHEVIKPQNANLLKLATICVSIYRNDLPGETVDEGIKDFMQAMGPFMISSVASKFYEKQQKDLN